jgi:hypothetical protein
MSPLRAVGHAALPWATTSSSSRVAPAHRLVVPTTGPQGGTTARVAAWLDEGDVR